MTAALPSWVDGELVAAGVAAIPADDQGFALGLAVFETLLQEDGRRYFERRHLARLECGSSVLGIRFPLPHDPAAALASFGAELGMGSYAIRLSLSRGSPGGPPRMVLTARVADLSAAAGIAVSIASHPKVLDLALEGTKSTSRLRNVLSREEAEAQGAWDALVRTSQGDLAEGTVSNLFIAGGDRVATPALGRGALAGVVRGELIAGFHEDGVEVEERRVELDELRRCDEVFLTNSIVRIAPVHTVLGVREGLPGTSGAWSRRAAAVLARREAEDLTRAESGA